MKATEDGLLSDATGRDLGGSVEFSPEEATFFSHIAGMQSARAALRKRRKERIIVDEPEEGEEEGDAN